MVSIEVALGSGETNPEAKTWQDCIEKKIKKLIYCFTPIHIIHALYRTVREEVQKECRKSTPDPETDNSSLDVFNAAYHLLREWIREPAWNRCKQVAEDYNSSKKKIP